MKRQMIVSFWGVRGTIPCPGPATVRYGGNTTCVSIELGADDNVDKTLILDAGTGIRELGKHLVHNRSDIFLLTTHIHWDHIQGFPAFAPIYQAGRVIYLLPTLEEHVARSLVEQMDGFHYPVRGEQLLSDCRFITEDPTLFFRKHGYELSWIALNHPGGGHGFRVENEGRAVVFLTDNELDPPSARATEFDDFVRFSHGCDVLVHDAQYLQPDMPAKHGWGHSLVEQALALGAAAEVKHLVLFHHDPDRSDPELDAIQADATEWCRMHAPAMRCTVAYEGLTLRL